MGALGGSQWGYGETYRGKADAIGEGGSPEGDGGAIGE